MIPPTRSSPEEERPCRADAWASPGGTRADGMVGTDESRALAIVVVVVAGLALDQHFPFWGQTLTNVGVWAFFLGWLRDSEARQRLCLTTCVVYATLGEIFLSLAWGLYDYRLANVPLFVPPGHALLFALGWTLAARLGTWVSWFVPLAATPFVCLLLATGAGTLDALLFAVFLACVALGGARRLYAVMFVLSLAMELYGTWLGNWRWHTEVPWLGLTTINPPLAAGAFYCVLDLLVVTTVSKLGVAVDREIPPTHLAATAPSRNSRSAATTGIAAAASREY